MQLLLFISHLSFFMFDCFEIVIIVPNAIFDCYSFFLSDFQIKLVIVFFFNEKFNKR